MAPMHSHVVSVFVYNLHINIFSRVYSYVTRVLAVCYSCVLVCCSYACYSYVLVCYSCVVLVTIISFYLAVAVVVCFVFFLCLSEITSCYIYYIKNRNT